MASLRTLFVKFTGLFDKERLEQRLDEDVRAHLDMLTEENLRKGMSPEDARYAARREFGNVASVKEECRDRWSIRIIEELAQDLRYGLRQLRHNPGFTAVAIVTLALGIGANTAVFTLVNSVLLQPLPYRNPSKLVAVYQSPPAKSFPGIKTFAIAPANYLDWQRRNRAFTSMAIYHFAALNLTGTEHPEALKAARISADFFKVLGVEPWIGRNFSPEEEQSGHAAEVILGTDFWHAHFGTDRNIIGQKLTFDGRPYTIIGIMPPNFRSPSWAKVWIPLGWTAAERAVRGNHTYLAIARLKPGVGIASAQAEMNTISSRLAEQYPDDDSGWGAVLVPLHEDLVGEVQPTLLILLGAVALVLLIACANIGNLVLERSLGRRKEMAVRTALGASRSRVLRQVLSETALLGLAGGVLGLLFAYFSVALFTHYPALHLPRASEIRLDGWVLAFTLSVSILTGILSGLAAGLHATRVDLNKALKAGLGRTDSYSGHGRTRRALVISEIALSLMLLAGAGLLIRTLWSLRSTSPGFDPSDLLTFSLVMPQSKYSTPSRKWQLVHEVGQRLAALPGVLSVGGANTLPLTGGESHWPIAIEGRPAGTASEQPEVTTSLVTAAYLQTLRVPLLTGRFLTDSDRAGTQPVIVISQAMAKRFWPGENPLGKHLTTVFAPGMSFEVVGVVGNIRISSLADETPVEAMYIPILQFPDFAMSFAVRTSVPPLGMVPAVARAVHQIDPDQPLGDVMTMSQIMNDSLARRRFSMMLLAAFAGLAVILAAIGIFGIIAHSVSRRTHELGIRMALGAEKNDVLRMVVGQGLKLALIGVAVGIAGALALTRFLSSLLYGVKATDPLTFIAVSLIMIAVALAACYIPARRAAKVDPMVALRYE
ncbi:MAG TPA: ABC transporter permease [Terriglobia bacterium]|nr:ABC transporter permease [Terriglobia bacterium]